MSFLNDLVTMQPGIAFCARDTCNVNLDFGQKKVTKNSFHAQGDTVAASIGSSLSFGTESVNSDAYQHTLVASHSMLSFLNTFLL